MRKKYSQAALKKSAEGTSSLLSFFESKKRGRADEGKGLLGFPQDSAFVDAVKVEDLDEEEPLNWTPTVFSTSRVSAPDTSVEAHTSFVAELPRRPGHVAVRSGSSKGKGDLVLVIKKTLLLICTKGPTVGRRKTVSRATLTRVSFPAGTARPTFSMPLKTTPSALSLRRSSPTVMVFTSSWRSLAFFAGRLKQSRGRWTPR
ncbi:unnamed protein product [Hapterophycus canaliculatus]